VAAQVPPGLDEGVVNIAITRMGGAAGTPLPPCVYLGSSYRCLSGMGSGGTLAATANPAVFTFTDTTPTPGTFGALHVGNYLIEPATGRAMPIVGAAGSQLAIQAGTGAAAGSVAEWISAAGIGPIALTANPDGSNPGAAPEFLNDTDTVRVTIATSATSGGHFAYQSSGNIPVGDSFSLDAATTTLVQSALNLTTTTPLRFGCDTTGPNACNLQNAQGTIVVIDSTDATSFADETDMGTPARFTGSLTCAAFDTKVDVPEAAFAVLNAGAPTKLRVTVFRVAFEQMVNPAPPRNTINVIAGHAIVKFQTR
jgi:hypothetical protein